MSNAEVSEKLTMSHLKVDGDLALRGEFSTKIDLSFSNIRSNLDLSRAKLVSLDLTSSKLNELRLGSGVHQPPQWPDEGVLILRNTTVNAIQDGLEPDPWPPELVLDGFTYQHLGGFVGQMTAADKAARPVTMTDADMAARPVSWFISWLARDKAYTPQPYKQLADLLRDAGENGMADTIVYEGWERERDQSSGSARWWGLTLLKYTIGYGLGYRYFWSLFWVCGFVLMGIVVLHWSGALRSNGLTWAVFCSLDLLLPVVRLDNRHKEYIQQMSGCGIYYFYIHQLAGWILASFLIAGLSGLPQL